nr:hypothetical protein [Chromobacterium sp. ASV5]
MKTLLLLLLIAVVAGLLKRFWLADEETTHLSHYLPDKDHV